MLFREVTNIAGDLRLPLHGFERSCRETRERLRHSLRQLEKHAATSRRSASLLSNQNAAWTF